MRQNAEEEYTSSKYKLQIMPKMISKEESNLKREIISCNKI